MLVQAVPLMLAPVDHAMLVRAVHLMHARVVVLMPALGVPLMLVQVVLRMLGPVAPPTLGQVVHAMLVRVGHAILVPEADGIAQPFADGCGNIFAIGQCRTQITLQHPTGPVQIAGQWRLIQTQFGAQGLAAGILAAHLVAAVAGRQMQVGLRIPLVGGDAIENPAQGAGARTQQTLHAEDGII